MGGFYGMLNPNRRAGGSYRNPDRITLGMFHVTVNAPSTESANDVARWQSTQQNVFSGYHSLFDSNEHLPYFPDDRLANGCRYGFNTFSVHLSFACHTDSWTVYPEWSTKAIGHAAIEVKRLHDTYGLPLRILSRQEALRGVKGFTYHAIADPDRRSDPGTLFPIELLFMMASEIKRVPEIITALGADVITRGDIGGHVTKIQWLINQEANGDRNVGIATDGKFGPKTESAVAFFQQRHGLQVSGVVDLPTYMRLHEITAH